MAGEESGINFSKCAQVAQEIADKLHLTNSVVQNMVEVLIVVLQRSWKASIDSNTNEVGNPDNNVVCMSESIAAIY